MTQDKTALLPEGLEAAIRAIKRSSCAYSDIATAAITAYLAALRSMPPDDGWRTIDENTATPALVCAFGDGDHNWLPMLAYKVGGKWERPASRDGLPYEPTHYLPLDALPPPPEAV